MNEATLIDIGRDAIWVSFQLSAPLMAVATIVGVIIALVQALTTVQEATLTFVPKMAAMLVVMVLLLPFMMATLTEFTHAMFDHIVTLG